MRQIQDTTQMKLFNIVHAEGVDLHFITHDIEHDELVKVVNFLETKGFIIYDKEDINLVTSVTVEQRENCAISFKATEENVIQIGKDGISGKFLEVSI